MNVRFYAQVGHNIYILCHQLSKHSEELHRLLHNTDATNTSDKLQRALLHYGQNTAQIEVSSWYLFSLLYCYTEKLYSRAIFSAILKSF